MMKIKKFIVNEFQVNAFVVYDETQEAVIIDGAVKFKNEQEELFAFIEANELNIKYILNTHGHVDHISGNAKLKEKFGIDILMNSEDDFLVDSAVSHANAYGLNIDQPPKVDVDIDENTIIKFGNSEFKCIHVPGHTPGSIAFYSEDNSVVFTGDALFAGSIGRTDLPKGDYKTLIDSIKSKLMSLPRETKVYCGHGPETSINDEMISNPFL